MRDLYCNIVNVGASVVTVWPHLDEFLSSGDGVLVFSHTAGKQGLMGWGRREFARLLCV